jgi:hypothetical protein
MFMESDARRPQPFEIHGFVGQEIGQVGALGVFDRRMRESSKAKAA